MCFVNQSLLLGLRGAWLGLVAFNDSKARMLTDTLCSVIHLRKANLLLCWQSGNAS